SGLARLRPSGARQPQQRSKHLNWEALGRMGREVLCLMPRVAARFRAPVPVSSCKSNKPPCSRTRLVRRALAKESRSDEMNSAVSAKGVARAGESRGFLVLALASGFLYAQQRPDAGQVLEQTRQPLRLPPPAEPVLPAPPEPKPALPVSPHLRVKVQQFTFTGNTLYSEEQLQPIVEEFLGKELDFEGLNEAATKVRAFSRARGYFLAQAYLPQQAIRNGRVEIAIIEGRIGQVELDRRPGVHIADSLLVGIIGTHLKQGEIITETG